MFRSMLGHDDKGAQKLVNLDPWVEKASKRSKIGLEAWNHVSFRKSSEKSKPVGVFGLLN